jgi:hypothetical protein
MGVDLVFRIACCDRGSFCLPIGSDERSKSVLSVFLGESVQCHGGYLDPVPSSIKKEAAQASFHDQRRVFNAFDQASNWSSMSVTFFL